MNDQLGNKLVDTLNKVETAIPGLTHDVLGWRTMLNGLEMFIGLLIVGLAVFIVATSLKGYNFTHEEIELGKAKDDLSALFFFGGICLGLIGLVLVIDGLITLIKIHFYTGAYLLDYVIDRANDIKR